MVYLFDVPAYFILLRETLEVTIILAVLLGFINKLDNVDDSLKKKFKRQIWIGTGTGFAVSLIIGATFITFFYTVGRNVWEESESAWEGSFSLIASVVITLMSLSMIRVQQWRTKWENKLEDATNKYLKKHEQGNRWALIFLPFTVVCRECVETIVFIAGIGYDKPPSGLPIPIITGILTGFVVGYLIYKGSHKASINLFFIATSIFLFFFAAGLFSSSVHELQEATGSYEHIVWNLSCCDPKENYFWGIMKTLFGWRNVATVGTTVSYFLYWFFVGLLFLFMYYKERRTAAKHNNQFDDTTDIKDEVVTTTNTRDEVVTNTKDEVVTTTNIKDEVVATTNIKDEAVITTA